MKKLVFTVPILVIILIATYLFVAGNSDDEKDEKALCGQSMAAQNISFERALPPESSEELEKRSDIVIKGEVCKIIKTYTDGDERREKCEDCPGGGTQNSQDVIIKVQDVIKGDYKEVTIQARKEITAYSLKVGDDGVFYISLDEDREKYSLNGEYWPVED